MSKLILKQQESPYTISDLEQLGQHIGQVRREDEKRTSEYFKSVHQKVYQEQIEDPEELDCLSSAEFSRLLKYAAQQKDFERPRDELVTRLGSGKLAIQDLYFVLFHWDDSALQQQVVQYLTNNTHDAVSVISIASTQEDDWEEFDYIELGRIALNSRSGWRSKSLENPSRPFIQRSIPASSLLVIWPAYRGWKPISRMP